MEALATCAQQAASVSLELQNVRNAAQGVTLAVALRFVKNAKLQSIHSKELGFVVFARPEQSRQLMQAVARCVLPEASQPPEEPNVLYVRRGR